MIHNYGDYAGISPLCQVRLRQYPDIDPMNPDDWEDAQHQWGYSGRIHVMQKCFDCDAVRPIPMHGHWPEAQVFIMQTAFSILRKGMQ